MSSWEGLGGRAQRCSLRSRLPPAAQSWQPRTEKAATNPGAFPQDSPGTAVSGDPVCRGLSDPKYPKELSALRHERRPLG